MANRLYQPVLWVIIIAATLASGFILADRVDVEQASRVVTLAADYQQVETLARWSGLSKAEVINRLQQQGVNALLFKEQTIEDLQQKLWVRSGAEALDALPKSLQAQVRSDYTYFFTCDPVLAERVKLQLHYKIPGGMVQELDADDWYVLGVPMPAKELEKLGLGFSEEDLALAAQQGMLIVPQLRWWYGAEQELTAVLKPLLSYREHIVAILFNDKYLPGYPDNLQYLISGLQQLKAPLGIIEFFPQAGLEELAMLLDRNAIRVHSISIEEMEKLTFTEALARYKLAARERNMRLLITRLKLTPGTGDWLKDNLSYLGQLKQALLDDGFTLGQARTFVPFPFSRRMVFIAGLGVLAAGVLLLQQCRLARLAVILGVLGAIIWTVVLWQQIQVLLARQAMALGAAIIFPTLAVLTAWSAKPRGLGAALFVLLRTTLVAFLGALIIAAILADNSFFLKLNEFKGVKLAFIIPLLIFAAVAIICLEGRQTWDALKQWLNAPLTAKLIILAAVAAVAGLVYISRSGNEGVGLLPFEGQLRSFLDDVLLTRPRTKEFLIGYPFLLLSLVLGNQHRYLPLWLLGLVGQISLVNTFCHLHIPLLISLQRTFNGLWLGLFLGLLLVGFVCAIKKVAKKLPLGSR
ncbi:MAG: hypothetical protein GX039_08670 [Clostridia bacterium]|nr:hypothetical protein [Clostridia bacterium]